MSLLEVNKILASIIVAILVVTIISYLGDLIVNIDADKSKEIAYKIEIEENLPWLYQQIKLVNPQVIVLVGATALEAILKIKSPISILRGKWINWDGRLVMPVFHPSYLLRNPSKEEGTPMSFTKLDFLKIKEKIDSL